MAETINRYPELDYLQNMNWNDNAPTNENEFTPILALAYACFDVEEEENEFTIQCTFFQKTQQEFQVLTQRIPPDYGIIQNLSGCFKLLNLSYHFPGRLLRETAMRIGQAMDNADLNNKFKLYARQIKNQPLSPNITYFECYQICVSEIIKPLQQN